MEMKRLKNPGVTKFCYFLAKFAFASMASCELYYFASFLTDGAMLSAAIVGVIMTVTSAIDTVTTFINGVILEKVRMPWGKCRSWLLVGPPVFTILTLFMFSRISDNEMVSAVVIIIGFVVGHVIWTVTESAHAALSVAITDDLDERMALSINSGRGQMGSGLIFGIISVPLIAVFGNLTQSPARGYTLFVGLMGIFCCVGYWLLFAVTKGCEDTDRPVKGAAAPKQKGPSGLAMLKSIANPSLITLIITGALGNCSMFLTSAVTFYYFNYNLNAMALMGVFMTVRSVAALGASWLTPLLMKIFKGSKKSVTIFGSVIAAAHMFILWGIRPNFIVYAVVSVIASLLASSGTMLSMAMFNDCAVYSEWKTGQDVKGFIMSMLNIPVKLALLVRSVLVAAILASINYTAGAPVTDTVLQAFNNAYLLYPAIMGVAGLIIMLVGYRLKEADVAKMIEEVNARKGGAPAEAASVSAPPAE
ncbi:MAG: hypothetical protein HFF09_00485 [Oscillospiraceae bacterium]|nr:hypothetical protein [Oscillospiraceae bacterium]